MSRALPRSRRGEHNTEWSRGIQEEAPEVNLRGLRTRSSDYIALRLLLSRLACLRYENRDSYIAFHLPSDGSLAYSALYMPVKREE